MVSISHLDTLNQSSEVIPLTVEGWQQLIEAGICPPDFVVVHHSHRAVLAKLDGKPVGVITYDRAEWVRTYYIQIGYTKPEFRRQGVYRAMWEALKSRAKEDGFRFIESGIPLNNTPMIEAAGRLGRQRFAYIYRDPV